MCIRDRRTLSNLSFDQRHAVKANVDYRFGFGKEYNGPKTKRSTKDGKLKTINWLENTGINFTFNGASGSPYTRSSRITSLTGVGTSQISGNLYGSNLPWQFWIDARIDKEFMLTLKKDKDNAKNNKYGYLSVYLEVLNVFNFKNITSVYAYTGNPDDDGFLAAAEYLSLIHISEPTRLGMISYAVFCLKKKKKNVTITKSDVQDNKHN
eukprot:TRINITY_DN6580_c0_g1_i1.p2 TRINITY_DN6580_c0_g1~~TRINITY_DN6580_c0_g1_i1.p2  ORF type:complete len:209 (-),score=12.15 TRINITY_DN6580_c0_g1_i1:6-632(-)